MRLSFALPALLLAACASDPSSPDRQKDDDPDPVVLEDGHVFRVFTLEDGGKAPRLRWVGDADGPYDESPEATAEPWIGFGQPFRIEWEITSRSGRVTGYQYRFNHAEDTPFYPRTGADAYFDDVDALDFTSEVPAYLAESVCYNDPDCFRSIRLASDVYPLEIKAIDEMGRVRTEPQFRIRFHINYEPKAVMQEDAVAGCDDPGHFPRYEFVPASGPSVHCTLLRGDTIPSGSVVRIRLDGVDRYDAADFPDGRCCDLPGDEGEQDVVYQAQVEIRAEHDRGDELSWSTFFGPETVEQELEFRTGPFDYTIIGKSVDEHARRSDGVGYFDFKSGYPPEIVSVSPADGTSIFLRNPLDGVWPQNDLDYDTVFEERYWDPSAKILLRYAGTGRERMEGHAFQIPLRFEGRANPAEPLPMDANATIHGGVLAWAYEWIGEFDAANELQEGPGYDDLGAFSESPELNLWAATGEQSVEIWFPLDFWFQPELYLDDPDPSSKEAIIAQGLRERLGQIDLMVRGRGSWAAVVERCPPMTAAQRVDVEAQSRCLPEQPLFNVGRYTETSVSRFELRVGLDREATGSMTEVWPAASAKRSERPSEAEILRRIRTARENG